MYSNKKQIGFAVETAVLPPVCPHTTSHVVVCAALPLALRSLYRCSDKVPTKQKEKQHDCNNNRVPVAISCFARSLALLSCHSSVGKCVLSIWWSRLIGQSRYEL